MKTVYLDNNATTQPTPEVVEAVRDALEQHWANPSSVHRAGQAVRQKVDLARAQVAALIGCRDRELIFTSGGTESNNLAIAGTLRIGDRSPALEGVKRVLVTTAIEHSAVREPAAYFGRCGVDVVRLPLDPAGWVSPDAVADALSRFADENAIVLLSVQWVNNETGVIQPIEAIADVVAKARTDHEMKVVFHCDATQAVGKMPVNVADVAVDLMSFASHKFHGPKGVGGLYMRRHVRLQPTNLGGPQERDRRGGTENVPGILGMAVAATQAVDFLHDVNAVARVTALRDHFESAVLDACPGAVVNGVDAPDGRLWNTTNIGFPRLEAEAILLGLSERGVYASAGAACSSGSLEPSPVLLAMGVPEVIAHGSVRFSLCRETTADEVDSALEVVPAVIERLSRTLPSTMPG